MIRKTFYLMDIENDNGKLRWSRTGCDAWNLIEDFDRFLRIYFPPFWWGRVRTELGLTLPTEKMAIDEAIRDLQARVDGEFCIKGVDGCEDMKLGIEALRLYKRAREQYPIIRPYWLPGEAED